MRVRSAPRALALAEMAELSVDMRYLLSPLVDGVAHQPELGGECGLRLGEVASGARQREQLAIDFDGVAVTAGHGVGDLAAPGRLARSLHPAGAARLRQ